MTSVYLFDEQGILCLYRIGSRVANNKCVGSAGGHFEPCEVSDARACALRELQEELGLTEADVPVGSGAGEYIKMKTFILDGNKFNDLEGFFCEIDKLFTKDLKWKTGHNLNAYNDLLRGGFGVHEYGEPIVIKWLNYEKSKKDLGDELFYRIVELTLHCEEISDHDCKLVLC